MTEAEQKFLSLFDNLKLQISPEAAKDLQKAMSDEQNQGPPIFLTGKVKIRLKHNSC